MADDLTIQVQAQVAEAIKALAEVQAGLGNVAKSAVAANVTAAPALSPFHAALTNVASGAMALGGGLKATAGAVEEVGGKVKGFVGDLAQLARGFLMNIGAITPFIGILTLAGVGFGVTSIVKQTLEWDTAVRNLTITMNGDVKAASTWLAVGQELGIQTDVMTKAMRYLSTDVDKNSSAFKSMGIATEDAHGKLLPMIDVLSQARTWFQAHATATDLAAKAQELFGRGGQALLPILMLDQSTFNAVAKEMTALGLVMSGQGLQSAQQFDYEVQHMGTVMQGLTVSIGHALMPGLAALVSALSAWVTDNLPAIVHAIQWAIAWVLGFVQAITGQKFALDSTVQSLAAVKASYGDTGNYADTMAGQAKNAAGAQRALTEATNDTVNALNSQIKAVDEQIKQLQEQTRLESQQDQMVRLSEEKAKKQKDIEKLRSDYGQALLLGDLAAAQTINDQLGQAQQSEADTERTITQQTDAYNRQTKINTLTDTKTKLQDQVTAVRQAAQDQMAAMQSGAAGMTAAIGTATGNIKQLVGDMSDQLKGILTSGGADSGKSWGDNVKTWITNTLNDFKKDKTLLDTVQTVGTAFGQAFMSGFGQAVIHWFKSWAGQAPPASASGKPSDLINWEQNQLAAATGSGGSWAVGWNVPGPVGVPRLEILHGGETVVPANSSRHGDKGGNITVGPFYINGATNPQATGDAVGAAVRKELNRAFGLG